MRHIKFFILVLFAPLIAKAQSVNVELLQDIDPSFRIKILYAQEDSLIYYQAKDDSVVITISLKESNKIYRFKNDFDNIVILLNNSICIYRYSNNFYSGTIMRPDKYIIDSLNMHYIDFAPDFNQYTFNYSDFIVSISASNLLNSKSIDPLIYHKLLITNYNEYCVASLRGIDIFDNRFQNHRFIEFNNLYYYEYVFFDTAESTLWFDSADGLYKLDLSNTDKIATPVLTSSKFTSSYYNHIENKLYCIIFNNNIYKFITFDFN